jgi:hypothetical protein
MDKNSVVGKVLVELKLMPSYAPLTERELEFINEEWDKLMREVGYESGR